MVNKLLNYKKTLRFNWCLDRFLKIEKFSKSILGTFSFVVCKYVTKHIGKDIDCDIVFKS